MRRMPFLLIALLALLLVACEDTASGGGTSSTTCEAGEVVTCYCFEGGSGMKECKADGTGYGVCQQTQAAPVAPAPDVCEQTDEYAYKGCFENDVFYFDNCDKKTQFVEQCAGGTSCLDGTCINGCQAEYTTVCRGSEVVYQNSCGEDGEVAMVCGSGSECVDGHCLEACVESSCAAGSAAPCPCADGSTGSQTCDGSGEWGACECTTGCVPQNTQAEKVCSGSAVIWLDDCGNPVGDATDCPEGCTNGACNTDDECSPAQFEKGCHQSEVWWFDYCGNPSAPLEGCGDGYCADGECVEACVPKAEKKCVNGDIFWFDSCGKQETIFEDCAQEEYCVNLSCVKGSYNGDWWIEPKVATPGFLGGKWTLTVDDDTGVVTFIDTTAPASVGDVVYTGTLDGKHLEASGSYTYDIGGGYVMEIDSTIFLDFSADAESTGVAPPTDCDGTLQDSSITQVTGYKM